MATHEAQVDDVRARAPLTDRVNVEPAILHGMTVTEAKWIAVAAFLVFVLLGGLIFGTTGFWQVPLLMTLIGPILILWFGSKYLARLKRGRPDGYYNQALNRWLAGHGLANSQFITHSGWWSLGRDAEISLVSPLEPPVESFAASERSPVEDHE